MTSRGFLMFAHNNDQVHYGAIALCNALMIKHNLENSDVCLITDESTIREIKIRCGEEMFEKAFDHVVIDDSKNRKGNTQERRFNDTRHTNHDLLWYNQSRVNAFNLSPFDETILIDCDYLVMNNMFDKVWGIADDYLINKHVVTLEHKSADAVDQRLCPTGIPMYWATCVYFKKTDAAKLLFDLVEHIRNNYEYYQFLYDFSGVVYRNDYAFSIAIHILNGFTENNDNAFPTPYILTSFDCDDIHSIPNINEIVFFVNNTTEQWKFMAHRTKDLNVHILNKFAIDRQVSRIIELYGKTQ